MAIFAAHNPLVFAFGILGNIVSFVVFLAPLPTFYRVVKKKSTEGFQSVPYVVSLLSAMLWLYYAWEKKGELLLVTINVFGFLVETIYIALYMAYSPNQARVFTLRLIVLLNLGGFCLVILVTRLLAQGEDRVKLLGWICVAFSISVFVAPLSIIRVVIRTKSVEFMPFPLSFFLTLSAIMWLCYGIFLKDLYVALPNVAGLFFGVLQMGLYVFYKNHQHQHQHQPGKFPEHKLQVQSYLQNQTPTHPHVQVSVESLSNQHPTTTTSSTAESDHDEQQLGNLICIKITDDHDIFANHRHHHHQPAAAAPMICNIQAAVEATHSVPVAAVPVPNPSQQVICGV